MGQTPTWAWSWFRGTKPTPREQTCVRHCQRLRDGRKTRSSSRQLSGQGRAPAQRILDFPESTGSLQERLPERHAVPFSSSLRRSVVKAMRLRQDQAHTRGMEGQWLLLGFFSHSHTYARSIPEGTRDSRGPAWRRHKAGHTGDTGGDNPAPGESGPRVPTLWRAERVGGRDPGTDSGWYRRLPWLAGGSQEGPGAATGGSPVFPVRPHSPVAAASRRSPGPQQLRGLPVPRLRRALRHRRGHPRSISN